MFESTCQLNLKQKRVWEILPDVMCKTTDPNGLCLKGSMYHDDEHAATFLITHEMEQKCDQQNNCRLEANVKATLEKKKKGNGSAVKTDHSLINCHTHPFKCYLDEKCIWGWPSGEDMRESILFMMNKNLVHLVYAMEGIYTIQVNPLLYSVMINLPQEIAEHQQTLNSNSNSNSNNKLKFTENTIRGLIVLLVEIIFKGTHAFRNCSYLKTINREDSYITPLDWIEYSNQFNLSCLLPEEYERNYKQSSHTNIPTNHIPDLKSNRPHLLTLPEYLRSALNDTIYEINRNGSCYSSQLDPSREEVNEMMFEFYHGYLAMIIDAINTQLNQEPKNNWFFKTAFYPNTINGESIVDCFMRFSLRSRVQEAFKLIRQLYNQGKQKKQSSNKKINTKNIHKNKNINKNKLVFHFYPNVIKICGYEITNQTSCKLR